MWALRPIPKRYHYNLKHTLEVDFLVAGNQREMKTAVDVIYSRESDQTRAKNRLDARDISVSGTEALRLAMKLGKGWFSLLLAETLHTDTFIPDYILRAIAFACAGNVTDEVIKRIGIQARKGIEKLVGTQVYLELFVKIDPRWLKNAKRIESLGYH